MAALFDGTANQRLRNASQRFTLTPPVSFGFAARWRTSASDSVLFSASPYSTDADGFVVYKSATNILGFGIFDSGGYSEATTATAITDNAEMYLVCRWISATNWRIAVHRSGSTAPDHAQNTTSRSPTSLNAWGFGWAGATPGSDVPVGRAGHFWMTFTDVQRGGGQLDNALLKVLAQDGPMAVPHIRNSLIEYLPLVDSLTGGKGDYYSSRGRMSWEALNGVQLAA